MKNTTTNHSDLPCSCSTLEAYVDGLCPGCTEAADRDADLKEHLDAQPARLSELRSKQWHAANAAGTLAPPEDEGPDDRYYSGTGESMDDDSYTRYLNRG